MTGFSRTPDQGTGTPALRVVGARPLTLGDLHPPNVLLALSLLQHRPWCPDCAGHASQLYAALLGCGIEEIAKGGASA